MANFQFEIVDSLIVGLEHIFKLNSQLVVLVFILQTPHRLFNVLEKLLPIIPVDSSECQKRVETVEAENESDESWNFAVDAFDFRPEIIFGIIIGVVLRERMGKGGKVKFLF